MTHTTCRPHARFSTRWILSLPVCWMLVCLLASCAVQAADDTPPVVVATQPLTANAPSAKKPTGQEISVTSVPYARCTIQFAEQGGSESTHVVFADDLGIVHLWAHRAPEQYDVICTENGRSVTHVLDLSSDAAFGPPVPAPGTVAAEVKVRPPLADPASVDASTLMQRGYPPPPDPTKSPEFYQKWLEQVSKPAFTKLAHGVKRSDIHFDNVTNVADTSWASILTDNVTNDPFYAAAAYITSPLTANTPNNTQIAYWVGVNGSLFIGGDNPIIQDGLLVSVTGNVESTSPWVEYFPDSPLFVDAYMTPPGGGAAVLPGDFLFIDSWACDSAGNYHPGGGTTLNNYGCFYIYNYRTSLYVIGPLPAPTSINPFTGGTAEIVMERPNATAGVPIPSFDATGAWFQAVTDSGASTDLTTNHYLNATLVNGSNQAMVAPYHVPGDPVAVEFYFGQSQ